MGTVLSQVSDYNSEENNILKRIHILKADVSKYRPEVCKSEKSKILQKIQKVTLGTGGGGGGGVSVSRLSDRVLQARDGVSRKKMFHKSNQL